MATSIRTIGYQSIEIADRPGEGSRILSGLRGEGVNLLVFTGFPTAGGKAQLDFVPEDIEGFRKAAEKLGLKLSERKKAFLVQGEDHIGAAADVHEKIAAQGIDVVAAQAVCGGAGRFGMIVWVKPADYERTKKALLPGVSQSD